LNIAYVKKQGRSFSSLILIPRPLAAGAYPVNDILLINVVKNSVTNQRGIHKGFIFSARTKTLNPKVNTAVARAGMELWKIFVFATLKL